jgi:hypothetical protein
VRSSVKPSYAYDNLTERTREVWQQRLGRDLSGEDARQIVESVAGFFVLLAEWSRVEMPVPTPPGRRRGDRAPSALPDGAGEGA